MADPTDERFRRKVLVIIDNRHVTMHNRDRALAALERLVDDRVTGGTYDWSIALLSDKAHLMLPLTSDKEKLHSAVAAVRRIVANPERPTKEDIARIATLSNFDASNDSSITDTKVGNAPGETLRTIVDFGTNFQIHADASRTSET